MKLNNANEIVRAMVAGTMAQETFNNIVDRIINDRVDNSYEIIKYLKTKKDLKINIKSIENIIRVLARLGYVAGSMVGIITNLIEVSSVLMDNNFNKQFLKADGTVDMWLLQKVFPTLGKKASVDGYNRVFSADRLNIIVVENKQGRKIRLVKATKADIKIFVNQLKEAKTLTQEDLVKIGRDLEQIGRVLQELEIDSAKDATVKDDMMEITEFMSAFNCKLASKKVVVEDNFKEIMEQKRNNKKIDDLQVTIGDYVSLDKVYDRAAEEYKAFEEAHPELTADELYKNKLSIYNAERNNAYIEDPAMLLKANMIKNQEAHLNQIVELYKISDMSLFEQFETVLVKADAEVIEKIQRITVVAIEMINAHFAYKKDISMEKIEDVAAKLRNAIYTEGTRLGLKPEDTFEIAMSAGWLNRNNNNKLYKVASKYKFKYAAISALFETELKWFFNSDVMYKSIDVELPAGYALELNTPIDIVDGEAEVVLDNGDIDYIICTKEFDFTGQVMAILTEEGEVRFVKNVDEYAYEKVDFILFDELCDMTLDTNSYTHGDVTGPAIASRAVSEINTFNMDEAEAKLAKATNVQNLTAAFDAFNKYFRLPLIASDYYSYGVVNVSNSRYLTITKGEKSRVAARLLSNSRTRRVTEYANVDITVTGKGALVILK